MINVEIFVRKAVGLNKAVDVVVAETGAALDLTGYAIYWSAKISPTDPVVVAGSTADGRVTIPGATPGRFILAIPHTAFSAVTARDYLHDCVLVAPDTTRTVLFGGKLTIADSITVPA